MWPGSQYLDLIHLPCLSVEGANWWEGWRRGCGGGGVARKKHQFDGHLSRVAVPWVSPSFSSYLSIVLNCRPWLYFLGKKNLNLPKFFKIKIQVYLSPRKSQISKQFSEIILDLLRSPKVIWFNLFILHMKKLKPKHYLIYIVLEPRREHRTADFFSHENFPEDLQHVTPVNDLINMQLLGNMLQILSVGDLSSMGWYLSTGYVLVEHQPGQMVSFLTWGLVPLKMGVASVPK